MKIHSEAEMMKFAAKVAKNLQFPAVIELVGDVGTGKTTFTKGLADALGIEEPITSPSFTISKAYAFRDAEGEERELIHYDFYRLSEAGVMSEDLAESLSNPNALVVVEWADTVAELLPLERMMIEINYNDDGTREVRTNF